MLSSKEDLLRTRRLTLLQPEKPWKRHAPALVVNLSGGDIKLDLSTDLKHVVHATFAGRYSDQYLFGFHHLHALIGQDGEFNCQELDHYVGRLQRHVDNPPPSRYSIPKIDSIGGHFTVGFEGLSETDIHPISEPVFFGSPIEPANWGMWLLQGLPNAFAFVSAGQSGRFLCYAPEQWQQDLLAYVGVDLDRLIQQKPWTTYRCREIALHQVSTVDLVVDDLTRAILSAIGAHCRSAATVPAAGKLYVSRRSITKQLGGRYRALENEEALIAALESRGYLVVEPELLTFEEQVLRFSQASAVVGLGGAGLFNTAFCAPRTKVVSIEGTDAFALNHARFFASSELEYGFIIGQEDTSAGNYPHNPWSVDVERALKAIDSFI